MPDDSTMENANVAEASTPVDLPRRNTIPTRLLTRTSSFARTTASSTIPDPVSTEAEQTPRLKLADIREDATTIAADESIDKENALRIMKVFHDMENLLKSECVARDRKIAEAQFCLEKLKLEMELLQASLTRPSTPPPVQENDAISMFDNPPPAPQRRNKRMW